MDVSIIIINYKTPKLVIDCVKSIYQKTKGISFEVIIVDNYSGDNSVEIMRNELKEKVKIIESSDNIGFGRANNLGAQYAQGEYLFLLNSDTILVNNAIKILLDFIKSNKQIGVVGGNLYTVEKREAPSYCSEFEGIEEVKQASHWKKIIGERIKKSVSGRMGIRNHVDYSKNFNYTKDPIKVAYIFGADMMLSKKVFDEFKGFDPDFFMYSEEAELSWRITSAGYQIWNIPEAKIIHIDGASTKQDSEFSGRLYKLRMKGKMIYFHKRFGEKGSEELYYYKKLMLVRNIKLASLLKRKKLLEVTEEQLMQLDEVYKEFLELRLS